MGAGWNNLRKNVDMTLIWSECSWTQKSDRYTFRLARQIQEATKTFGDLTSSNMLCERKTKDVKLLYFLKV